MNPGNKVSKQEGGHNPVPAALSLVASLGKSRNPERLWTIPTAARRHSPRCIRFASDGIPLWRSTCCGPWGWGTVAQWSSRSSRTSPDLASSDPIATRPRPSGRSKSCHLRWLASSQHFAQQWLKLAKELLLHLHNARNPPWRWCFGCHSQWSSHLPPCCRVHCCAKQHLQHGACRCFWYIEIYCWPYD